MEGLIRVFLFFNFYYMNKLQKEVQEALNQQYNLELYSAQVYRAGAAYLDAQNLVGLAQWLKVQVVEETAHADKFYAYIYDVGGKVVLQDLAVPPQDFSSPLQVFELALAHEKKVTAAIQQLYALALAQKDYSTQVFLQWFIEEQVEEEANVEGILAQFKLAGIQREQGVGHGLLILDQKLGARAQHAQGN